MRRPLAFFADRRGAAAVEFSLVGAILLLGVVMLMDLGQFMFRWNQQAQAARMGARLAATHDPIAPELATMTGLETGVAMGQPAGAYLRVCTATACAGGGHSPAAFNRIFYGADALCGDPVSEAAMGVCDVMTDLQTGQLTVTYRDSGVDVAGTEGALRPLITVRISGAPSRAVMLNNLWPALAALPAVEATVLAEDMRTSP